MVPPAVVATTAKPSSSALPFGEEDPAFGFIGARVFVDDDGYSLGGGVAVADDGVGDVFDQGALLIERAALGQLDDYFRHMRSVR